MGGGPIFRSGPFFAKIRYIYIYIYIYIHIYRAILYRLLREGHCIGNCTPTRDRGQSEVKRSRRNFEAGQAVKLGIGGSLRTVKVPPGNRWAWLMLNSQGPRPDFRCGQGVKHEILMGQPGRGWKYMCPPLFMWGLLRLNEGKTFHSLAYTSSRSSNRASPG